MKTFSRTGGSQREVEENGAALVDQEWKNKLHGQQLSG